MLGGLTGLTLLRPADLTGGQQADCLKALERAESMLVAARSAILAAFTASAAYTGDGQYSPKAWLALQTRVTRAAAGAAVAWMRRLSDHPAVARDLAAGAISGSWARQVCDWSDRLPADRRPAADDILLAAQAGGATLADLADLAEEMFRRCAPPDRDGRGGPPDRGLTLDAHFRGAGRLAGDLTPRCAAALRAVLDSLGKKAGPEDTRTLPQRHHDALEEACRRLVAAGGLPDRAGQPTQIQLHMTLDELLRLTGTNPASAAEYDGAGSPNPSPTTSPASRPAPDDPEGPPAGPHRASGSAGARPTRGDPARPGLGDPARPGGDEAAKHGGSAGARPTPGDRATPGGGETSMPSGSAGARPSRSDQARPGGSDADFWHGPVGRRLTGLAPEPPAGRNGGPAGDVPGWLPRAAGPGAACDATIIPVVTGRVDPVLLDQLAAQLTSRRAASAGSATGPPGAADLPGAAVPGRLAPDARQTARDLILAQAVRLLSGPRGLAAALRTGLPCPPAASASIPLDIGRPSDTIPPHLRRAVIARDRTCRFPGCDQPPAACEVHHVVWRSRGGRTRLVNLVLLCRFHHLIAIHEWGWAITLHPDATVTATSPDGRTVMRSHSPPAAA